MNYFSASGQSTTTIDNVTLTKMVRTCEKCLDDLDDYKMLDSEQKLIIEIRGARIADLEITQVDLKKAIEKIKESYKDLQRSIKHKRFWAWLVGVLEGAAIGAITIAVLFAI